MTVSVIIPTYNERENIGRLVPRIIRQLNKRLAEIIVVDDASPDGTAQAVIALAQTDRRVKLLARPRAEGVGAALQAGYAAAVGTIILSSDADLAFPVKEMADLLAAIDQGADLAVGSRHLPNGSYEKKSLKTVIKHLISRSGNWLATLITGVPVHDFSANFRALRRSAWPALQLTEKGNGWLGEMLIAAHAQGLIIKEVPVSFHDRRYGQSKNLLIKQVPLFFASLVRHTLKHRWRIGHV